MFLLNIIMIAITLVATTYLVIKVVKYYLKYVNTFFWNLGDVILTISCVTVSLISYLICIQAICILLKGGL